MAESAEMVRKSVVPIVVLQLFVDSTFCPLPSWILTYLHSE